MGENVGDVRYVLRQQCGSGGMGVVWKAEDTLFGGYVAIKLIRRDSVNDEKLLVEALTKEARLQARLCQPDRHPNIAVITDLRLLGEDDIGVVMEYVDGKTLQAIIGPRNRPQPITLEQFFAWMTQVCAGLEFAHERGVIHRDIKPQNLMINSDGAVKIVDWGVAKNVQAAGGSASYTIAGTLNYMPPEVVRLEWLTREDRVRSEGVDHRADIYSLGVTMYQLLTRRQPFDSKGEIDRGVTEWHHEDLGKHAQNSLSKIVLKAMAREAAARYQTARELQTALEEWQSRHLFGDDIARARASEAEGDLANAELLFRGLLSQYDFILEPYQEAAQFYIRRCREDMAIEVLTSGIRRFPGHGSFYEARGRLYAKRNSPLAISDLDTALRLLPAAAREKGARQLQAMLKRLRANRTAGA